MVGMVGAAMLVLVLELELVLDTTTGAAGVL